MKKNLLFTILFLTGNIFTVHSENTGNEKPEFSLNGEPSVVLLINQYDSVFFDIAGAVINGSTVEFPVYMRTDEVINALDFAFKYDQTHLEYDTIINLTSYIEPLAYYNPNDSTVRLTSYSFSQPYTNDTALFIIRFNLLSGQLCSADIDSVSALLNGDAASPSVSDCITALEEFHESNNLILYPNPANEILFVEARENSTIEIFDLNSKIVYSQNAVMEGIQTIYTDMLKNGIYLVKTNAGKTTVSSKFLISR